IEEWLGAQRPAPPPDLGAALRSAGWQGFERGRVEEGLAVLAIERIARARARPGRVRGSAFHLLEADALLTYACEAALHAEDPEAALLGVLAAARR
ncbi:MAG TPA: hypothetical protein VLA09_09425, partial [Longimicrobiales bacterium]|nr:hypothetical protein [Longimicrobiales bacterium]